MKKYNDFNNNVKRMTLESFNDFINEAAPVRDTGNYGGGGETYFANVKGNFAGAENTLVGSAFIKLFSFVKRKGMQAMLYWNKAKLDSIYNNAIIDYCMDNGINVPYEESPKTMTQEKPTTKEEPQTQVQEEKADADIIQYVNDIKEIIKSKSKDDICDISDELIKYVEETDKLIKIMEKTITEINKLIKNEKLTDKIAKLNYDKEVNEANLRYLNDLKNYIEKFVESCNVIPTTPTPTPTSSNESMVNEADDAVKLKTAESQRKASKKKKDIYGAKIKVKDEEFLRRFNDDDVRKGVTKEVLKHKGEIARQQLAAERFYLKDDGSVDRKLQNSWLKMISDVKGRYGKFMDVEAVDPGKVRKEIGQAEVEKITNNNNVGSIKNDFNKTKFALSCSENDIPLEPTSYKDLSSNDLCLLNGIQIGSDSDINILCSVGYITFDGKKHQTLKVLGVVDKLDKFIEDKSKMVDKVIYDVNKFPKALKPLKTKVKNINGVEEKVNSIYIINMYDKGLSVGKSSNNVVVTFLFSPEGMTSFKEKSVNKDFSFYSVKSGSEMVRVSSSSLAPVGTEKNFKVKLGLNDPMVFQQDDKELFLSDNAINKLSLNIRELGDNPEMKYLKSIKNGFKK